MQRIMPTASQFFSVSVMTCGILALFHFRLYMQLHYGLFLIESTPSGQDQRSLAIVPPSREMAAISPRLKSTIAMSDTKVDHNATLNGQPAVCVVVTAFNVVDFIQQSIESLLNQTYQNLYIVVVDDSSTDGTLEKLNMIYNEKFGQRLWLQGQTISLDIIQLPHNTLGGTGQPSNIGMSTCSPQARYLMFQDGDDYMELNAVEAMVASAESLGADVVMADFDTVSTSKTSQIVSKASYDTRYWRKIPSNKAFDPIENIDAIRVSPVPWRKIYRRKMILDNNLRFLEGDYFYEDNAFHWTVMTHAKKVAKINDVLFHHRSGREGQTSSTFEAKEARRRARQGTIFTLDTIQKASILAKLGGLLLNAFQIGLDIFSNNVTNSVIADEFFRKIRSTLWISKKQAYPALVRKFERRLDKIIEYWANYDAGQAILAGNEVKYVAGMAPSTKIFDLSLIIPTHNNGEGVLDLLETLFAELASPGFSFEVIVVDDASTDEVTKDALLDFAARNESNFYLLSTKSPSGAGRARNLAIPLVEGRFVYFADADDNYDFAALRSAVQYAFASGSDLVLLPYAVEHVHSNNESSVQDHMLPSDERIWTRIKERGNRTTKEDLKKEALSLINYPWKQITSSELIFTADVFFGPTIVHNDVQFHWTSIAAANKIGVYFDKKVCTHRKFDPSVRGQLTSVKDEKRMGVFNAIHFTQRALALAGILDQDESLVLSLWKDFVQKLLKWAFKQIPQSLKSDFQEKQMALWNQLRAAPRIRKGHPLPYWKTLYP